MSNRHFPEVKLNFNELIGEKIKSVESIKAEWGRTYSNYKLITCESGKRIMVAGSNPYKPNPELERMRDVDFFKPKEIASKVEWQEIKKREKEKEKKQRKRKQLEKLKKELNE